MITLVFAEKVSGFDFDQIGGMVLTSCENEINVTETDLNVNDEITDDFGGSPILAAVSGSESYEVLKGKENDYRDAFQNKRNY